MTVFKKISSTPVFNPNYSKCASTLVFTIKDIDGKKLYGTIFYDENTIAHIIINNNDISDFYIMDGMLIIINNIDIKCLVSLYEWESMCMRNNVTLVIPSL